MIKVIKGTDSRLTRLENRFSEIEKVTSSIQANTQSEKRDSSLSQDPELKEYKIIRPKIFSNEQTNNIGLPIQNLMPLNHLHEKTSIACTQRVDEIKLDLSLKIETLQIELEKLRFDLGFSNVK